MNDNQKTGIDIECLLAEAGADRNRAARRSIFFRLE
jgi:hypothetical protein